MADVLALHTYGAGLYPSCSILQPVPCLQAWEGSRGWHGTVGHCTQMGDQEEDSGSWLQTSSALTYAATWGVSQQMSDLSLYIFFSLSI